MQISETNFNRISSCQPEKMILLRIHKFREIKFIIKIYFKNLLQSHAENRNQIIRLNKKKLRNEVHSV